MDKEIKKEEMANPAANPENETKDELLEEINVSKVVNPETLQEESEESKKNLKQG